jgi:phage terminase large subunit GpA-like protein
METHAREVLIARAEPYPEGIAPHGACLVTAGVDCQPGIVWRIEIVGWLARLLWHGPQGIMKSRHHRTV